MGPRHIGTSGERREGGGLANSGRGCGPRDYQPNRQSRIQVRPRTHTPTPSHTHIYALRLFPLHQLLLMCALRPERATQHIASFIATVLDSSQKQKRLNFDTAPDLSRLARGLGPDTVPLVLYRREPQLIAEKLQKMAIKLEV